MKKPIAIIEMGTPPQVVIDRVGAQSRWFIDALGWQEEQYTIYRPEHHDELPTKEQVSCAIISGSWSMVTEQIDWSERVAQWIRQVMADGLPLFGVCYGHQLMAHALGGEVIDNPNGPEQGLHTLYSTKQQANQDQLLSVVMDHQVNEFPAWLCHYQTVSKVPEGAEVLLCSNLDKNQMIRYNSCTYSVQFHPEFSKETMRACYLAEEKNEADLHTSLSVCHEPELALSILKRFTEVYSENYLAKNE